MLVTADALKNLRVGCGQLYKLASELGLKLQSLDPGTPASELERYFILDAPDKAPLEYTLARLTDCSEVEAAYVKPSGEPPS